MGAGMRGRPSRREFLATGMAAAGALALTPAFLREALAAPAVAGPSPYGPLLPPDGNNIMLPAGFSSRRIARGLEPVGGTAYPWHIFSDGAATFATGDGGWILVSNSESIAPTGAGASAIRFRPDGSIASAYRVLAGTNVNCAGGPTPWGTWLSGEEHAGGMIWECDPAGGLLGTPRPAMGLFNHEAAAVDPVGLRVYLTEDEPDGAFYRFTPSRYPDLSAGRLEAAIVGAGGSVTWGHVPDPLGVLTRRPTRNQVPGVTRFNGGEGIWYDRDVLYFTTKGDKKVWAYDPRSETIDVIFDRSLAPDSSLDAVDNVTVSSYGDIYVCEDGGNMEIGLITTERTVSPFLRMVGPEHAMSELAGVVFDPSGTRLYFASQGAYPPLPPEIASQLPSPTGRGPGAVYEVTGPFRLPTGGVIARFGPPAGELRPAGPLAPGGSDHDPPGLRVEVRRTVSRSALLSRGLVVDVDVDEAAAVAVALRTSGLSVVRYPGHGMDRPGLTTLARRTSRTHDARTLRLRLEPRGPARARLRRMRDTIDARLTVLARDEAGNDRIVTRSVRVTA